MARPTWKGSITFGLVDIPVALYPAEERNDLSFKQLDRNDLSPVGYKRVNKETGEEVAWDDIVKGYEYEPDQYVIMGPGDFQKANVEASKTIEIQDFVAAKEIDPMFFETPYYVEPQRKNSKGYALLRDALERTGKIGIAQFVLRTRQYLAALAPRGKLLVLNLLRYAQEIRSERAIEVAEAKLSGRERDMAEQLVDGMTARWDPKRYHDSWADDLHAVIQKKIKSGKVHEITEPEEDDARPKAEVHDLTRLLARSSERSERAVPRAVRRRRPSTARTLRRRESARGLARSLEGRGRASGAAARRRAPATRTPKARRHLRSVKRKKKAA